MDFRGVCRNHAQLRWALSFMWHDDEMWGSEWRRAGDGKNLVIDAGVIISE